MLRRPCYCFERITILNVAARVERMKEAKVEAEQIIAAYRAEMEAVYQKSLAAVRIIVVVFLCH